MKKKEATESRKKYNTFSEEFKEEAVELANRVGNSQASRDLGTTETSIRNWRKKLNPTPESLLKEENKKSYRELEKENKRLKKELGWMQEINTVLKKSTAIFSSD